MQEDVRGPVECTPHSQDDSEEGARHRCVASQPRQDRLEARSDHEWLLPIVEVVQATVPAEHQVTGPTHQGASEIERGPTIPAQAGLTDLYIPGGEPNLQAEERLPLQGQELLGPDLC